MERSRSSSCTRNPRRIDRTALQSSKVDRTTRRLVKYTTTRWSAPGILIVGCCHWTCSEFLLFSSADVSFLGSRLNGDSLSGFKERIKAWTIRARWKTEGFLDVLLLLLLLWRGVGSSVQRLWISLKDEQWNDECECDDVLWILTGDVIYDRHIDLIIFFWVCKEQLYRKIKKVWDFSRVWFWVWEKREKGILVFVSVFAFVSLLFVFWW